jgi:hypothetical protein
MVFQIVLTAIETMTVCRIIGIAVRTILTGDQLLTLRPCDSCSRGLTRARRRAVRITG